MQKTHQKTLDFFSLYRSHRLRKYALSGGIALFVAFSFVSFITAPIDMNGLMASVANISSAATIQNYDADLIMTRKDDLISLTFGTRATRVDTIDLTILGDPTKLHSIFASSPDIRVIGQSEIGVYHVSIDMHGRDIEVGTLVAEMGVNFDSGASIIISDTQFMSDGQRYSLTNKGE